MLHGIPVYIHPAGLIRKRALFDEIRCTLRGYHVENIVLFFHLIHDFTVFIHIIDGNFIVCFHGLEIVQKVRGDAIALHYIAKNVGHFRNPENDRSAGGKCDVDILEVPVPAPGIGGEIHYLLGCTTTFKGRVRLRKDRFALFHRVDGFPCVIQILVAVHTEDPFASNIFL